MQTANVMVALGGDTGNTVPKYGVTAAEIAVLRSIHGNEAVFDIEPVGEVQRGHRDERQRLVEGYRSKDSDGKSIVEGLFPGAAARVFETLDELELPEELFKTTERMKAVADAPEAPAENAPKSKKAAAKKLAPKKEDADQIEAEVANDGIQDL
jgi:hypothetical protein